LNFITGIAQWIRMVRYERPLTFSFRKGTNKSSLSKPIKAFITATTNSPSGANHFSIAEVHAKLSVKDRYRRPSLQAPAQLLKDLSWLVHAVSPRTERLRSIVLAII
jgi:hypothetical protein